jgi:hypothetical protein
LPSTPELSTLFNANALGIIRHHFHFRRKASTWSF